MTSLDWRQRAACRGHGELFFADDHFLQQLALKLCQGCAVRAECESYVREVEPSTTRVGVVAGFTARQRRGWPNPET